MQFTVLDKIQVLELDPQGTSISCKTYKFGFFGFRVEGLKV